MVSALPMAFNKGMKGAIGVMGSLREMRYLHLAAKVWRCSSPTRSHGANVAEPNPMPILPGVPPKAGAAPPFMLSERHAPLLKHFLAAL